LEVPRDSIELEKYLNSSLIHFAICLHLFWLLLLVKSKMSDLRKALAKFEF
jgi:hypothetical protein